MGKNIAQKIISSHLLAGEMTAGSEIGIRIDQTLIHDATGQTLSSCAEALLQAGAKDVFALTVARALPHHGLHQV